MSLDAWVSIFDFLRSLFPWILSFLRSLHTYYDCSAALQCKALESDPLAFIFRVDAVRQAASLGSGQGHRSTLIQNTLTLMQRFSLWMYCEMKASQPAFAKRALWNGKHIHILFVALFHPSFAQTADRSAQSRWCWQLVSPCYS